MELVKIEIVKVPEGEAPEEIRKAWVGVNLPAIRCESVPGARHVLSGRSVNYGSSYSVRWLDAVDMLYAANKKKAAEFWHNVMRDPEDRLVFHADECRELVSA